MPLAPAALDVRASRRVTAAAIAAALQALFYWLILHEVVEPTALPSSTSLEVTLLQTVRRLRPTAPPPKHEERMRLQQSPQSAGRAPRAAPPPTLTQSTTPPQATRPAAHAPIDWQGAIRAEVRANESRATSGKLRFGFPQQSAAAPPAPKFEWDYAPTHRLEMLPSGGMLINLTDRCAVVFYGILIPVCKIGTIPTNGRLFDHMHDRRNDLPGGLP